MRIITGSARGMKLFSPVGDEVRPTTEMAKEGIFSSIQFEIEGARVLDLFSGSGQLGLEALSRGASFAVFCDCAAKSIDVTRKNVMKTGFSEKCRIYQREYGECINQLSGAGEKFDFVFVDPPYGLNIAAEVAKRLFKKQLVTPGGAVICETDDPGLEGALSALEGAASVKKYKYGKSFIYVVRAEQ